MCTGIKIYAQNMSGKAGRAAGRSTHTHTHTHTHLRVAAPNQRRWIPAASPLSNMERTTAVIRTPRLASLFITALSVCRGHSHSRTLGFSVQRLELTVLGLCYYPCHGSRESCLRGARRLQH